ncbi:NAD(P)-dependent oxidoreductase [Chloroflexota bacterium]
MKEAKVVFINRADQTLREVFWEHVPPGFNVVWMAAGESSEDEIVAQLCDADFVLLTRASVPERALRGARQLKLIQTFSQGYDGVPIHVTSELGIPVANIGGANAIAVSEHTVLLILALLRNLSGSIAAVKEGKTAIDIDRKLYHHLQGKTVGIIGLGDIGRRVARKVRAFDADMIFYDKTEVPGTVVEEIKARPASLEELLRTADVVSLHVPLLASTRGLIGREQLKLMKPSAILINTSRGEVVDEKALTRALREKKIAGAGLDVFTKEPPEIDNPLLSMENVVSTPHIGGYAWENFLTRFDDVWGNVIGVWQGQPPRNVVTEH